MHWRRSALSGGLFLLTFGVLGTAAAQKKPLDHSVYDGWKSIRSTTISRDGKWVAYAIAPQEGDAEGTVRNVADSHTVTIPRPASLRFTKDSKFLIALIAPPFADTLKAKRAKAKPEDMPKNALEVLDLSTGKARTIDKVESFDLAEDDDGFVLYQLPAPPVTPKAAPAPAGKSSDEDQRRGAGAAAVAPTDSTAPEGKPYGLLNLKTGKEERIENVTSAVWSKNGAVLGYATASKDDKRDGVVYYDVAAGRRTEIVTAPGKYPKLALSPDGSVIAFTTTKENPKAKPLLYSLYVWRTKKRALEGVGADSMPKGWSINEGGGIEFSEKGSRLLYRTSPKPLPEAAAVPDDEKVSVDIWNWKDGKLQPEQVLQAKTERERGYLAVYDIASGKSVQICTRDLPSASIGDKNEGSYALAETSIPYDRENSWGSGEQDVYVIDVKTGARSRIADHWKGSAQLSTKGRYVALYDANAKSWLTYDPAGKRRTTLSRGVTTSLSDELDDHPDIAPSYGISGWTTDDARAIVNDRYDLWECDPAGVEPSIRLTHGREYQRRYRPVELDSENPVIEPDHLWLDTFDEDDKRDGLSVRTSSGVNKLFLEPKFFGGYMKAKGADTLLYTRQDFVEYPDLWLTDTSFHSPTKISDANPQQKNYNWGTAELIRWTSLDGIPLSGVVIRPENFDYTKKYPMISYFYERLSDDLYRYHPPAPSASTINLPLFASNGYCIFIPDIPYKVGYPGESALNAILPGIQAVEERGGIDPKRLGIQGQSWGGYQVAYLVTRTNMFACAEAGAPVGDMFSAYGGIRYGQGIVREGQYEHGQSRIGGTPWDSTLKYIENSPVFWADKIQTPLMIMSNDKDGAVPHTQGIEFFTALRRLNKPSWMVVYNDEDHNLVQRKNRKDLSIRLSQFFDHFLKGAPEPVWMSKGLPAVDKGRTMGTELEPTPR